MGEISTYAFASLIYAHYILSLKVCNTFMLVKKLDIPVRLSAAAVYVINSSVKWVEGTCDFWLTMSWLLSDLWV